MKKRRLLALVLALVLCLGVIPVSASAASSYNAGKALEYAKAHWNDGKGLCAEFVSNCLKAGGLSSWSASSTALFNQLKKEVVNGSKIATIQYLNTSGNSINPASNSGKASKGDPIFWYCSNCGYYMHTAIISDTSGSYYRKYQHNEARNNEPIYVNNCYDCGRRYSSVIVVHFGGATASAQLTVKEYFSCNVQINTTAGKSVNLYNNIGDTTRADVFGNGQTAYSTRGAKVSDGSTWYQIQAINQKGATITVWLNAGSPGVTVINRSTPPSMSFSTSSVTLDPRGSQTISVSFTGDEVYYLNWATSNSDVCTASWGETNWDRGTSSLTVKAGVPGTATMTVNLVDKNDRKFYSKSFAVTVRGYDISLSVSPSSVSLDLESSPSKEVTLRATGTLPSNSSISVQRTGVAQGEWTVAAMENGYATMLVSASKTGTGQIVFQVKNSSTGEVYASARLDVRATAPSYTISYDANGGQGAPGQQRKEYDKLLVLSSQKPTRTGYTFNGWAISAGASYANYQPGDYYYMDRDICLYAVWVPSTGVRYTVEHYLENRNGRQLESRDILTGTTGERVTPHAKSYPGYKAPVAQSDYIKGDGSTVIQYVYKAKNYTVQLLSTEGIEAVTGEGTYQYGDTVELNAVVADGYEWYQWSKDGEAGSSSLDQQYTFSMPDSDIILKAYATKLPEPEPDCSAGHTWGDWEIIAEAKCEEDGQRQHTCEVCGEVGVETIEALEHEWGDWAEDVPATCEETGSETRACARCEQKEFRELESLGHDYQVKQETETALLYTCTHCGDSYIEDRELGPQDVSSSGGMGNFSAGGKYYNGMFSDVQEADWFSANVRTACMLSLMEGVGGGRFAPGNSVTLAQAVTMAARIHKIYHTGKDSFPRYDGGNWYDPYVDYAREQGIIYENYSYNRPATREEFCHILAAALPREELTALSQKADFADQGDIVYQDDVALLRAAGVIDGVKENGRMYFKPWNTITRAQAAAIVTRMVKPDLRKG